MDRMRAASDQDLTTQSWRDPDRCLGASHKCTKVIEVSRRVNFINQRFLKCRWPFISSGKMWQFTTLTTPCGAIRCRIGVLGDGEGLPERVVGHPGIELGGVELAMPPQRGGQGSARFDSSRVGAMRCLLKQDETASMEGSDP